MAQSAINYNMSRRDPILEKIHERKNENSDSVESSNNF